MAGRGVTWWLSWMLALALGACDGSSDRSPAAPVTAAPPPVVPPAAGQAAPPAAGMAAMPPSSAGTAAPSQPEQRDAASPADAGGVADAADTDASAPDSEGRTLVPHASWACGMPEGVPAPEQGMLVFEIEAQLGEIHGVGQTPYGRRNLIEISGGTLQGAEISGELASGGLDWQLTLDNGVVEIEQVLLIRTDDGQSIYLRNCGVAAAPDRAVRIVPDFEAPNAGAHAWLNAGRFAGTRELDAAAGTLRMRVYDVSSAPAASADAVRIEKPAGVPAQPWECALAEGSRGAEVFRENVRIGGTVSVGASKRGTRTAIPITGGTTSGRIEAAVLAGGADFQLVDNGFVLDARYTLRDADAEIVLVRNCGPASALVPRFEARADGPYAWLNEGRWLSSSPGLAIGAVNITVYQAD